MTTALQRHALVLTLSAMTVAATRGRCTANMSYSTTPLWGRDRLSNSRFTTLVHVMQETNVVFKIYFRSEMNFSHSSCIQNFMTSGRLATRQQHKKQVEQVCLQVTRTSSTHFSSTRKSGGARTENCLGSVFVSYLKFFKKKKRKKKRKKKPPLVGVIAGSCTYLYYNYGN